MVSEKSSKVLSSIVIFLLLTASFPIIAGWIPLFQRIWIVLVCLFVSYIALSRKLHYGICTNYLIAYAAIVFLNAVSGDSLISSVPIGIVEVLILYVPFSIAIWTLSKSNISFTKKVLLLSACFFLIESICSFFILITQPFIIRTLYSVSQGEGGDSFMYSFYKLGLLDYSMGHAIPVLIAPLIYAYKGLAKTIWQKIFLAGNIGLCVFLVWISDSTTALIFAVFSLVIGFCTSLDGINSNIRRIAIISLLVMPFVVSDDVQHVALDVAENILGSESVYADKIEDFRYSINNEDTTGDIKGRVDRYTKSIQLFLHSPIWGSNDNPGNHAALIDRLAVLGLLGFIPLVMFFVTSIKSILPKLSESSKPFYFEGLFMGFMMLLTKGMWVWPMFFAMYLLLPFILYYTDSKVKQTC